MKAIPVALVTLIVTLAVALKGSRSQEVTTTPSTVQMESLHDLIRNMLKEVRSFMDKETDLNISPRKIGKIIAGVLPKVDIVGRVQKIYGKFCVTKDCKKHAKKCAEFLFPPEVCQFHRQCIPDFVNAVYNKEGGKKAMSTCVMKNMMDYYKVGDDSAPVKENVKALMESLLNNTTILLTERARKDLGDAVLRICEVPEGDDVCITDIIKFKKCLMDTCVRGMAYKDDGGDEDEDDDDDNDEDDE